MNLLKSIRLSVMTFAVGAMMTPGATVVPALASAEIDLSTIEDPSRRCQALGLVSFENAADMPANIVNVTYYEAKEATARETRFFHKRGVSQGNATSAGMEYFPEHCHVEGYITNHIKFSLMLPPPDAWNDNFMLAACDAWCGVVHLDTTVPGLYDGFATITNDGGHYSKAPFDGLWGYHDETAKINFAYEANHLSAQLGKAIAAEYYGSSVEYSYITGFSKGGNAGLMSAQRYPEDFDGIIVKAPVIPYNEKNAVHLTWLLEAVYPENDFDAVIYSDKAPLIDDAVTAACDGLDGVEDTIIDNPLVCDFDPIVLLCQEGQSELLNQCLNMEQVEAVRKMYQSPHDENGPYMSERVMPGTESDWARTFLPVRGADERTFIHTAAPSGIRYMVMDDPPGPTYDWRDFHYPTDRDRMTGTSALMNPDSVDLTEFRERGGKMIIVHGWADALISPLATIEWFDEMTEFMGGAEEAGDFAQLYLVPGMHHGSGGHGPHEFDALEPLVDWVENGVAPAELLMSDAEGARNYRERIFYPYPATSVYSGEGDPALATSYERVDP